MPDGSPWPKISIVTPSYNQAQFIEETICSVLLQDYPNLEYIIIDGDSTDGSVEIIKKYETQLAYWVSEPDRGQSHAINKGWQRATGEIVAWLNSDDTYEPGAIRKVASFMQNNPEVDMVYGKCFYIDKESLIVAPFQHQEFNVSKMIQDHRWYIPQQTVWLRRCILDKVGLLDEGLHFKMDRDLYIRIGLNGKVVKLPIHLANFRTHEDAKSTLRNDIKAWQDFKLIRRRYGGNTILKSDFYFWAKYLQKTIKTTILKLPVISGIVPKIYRGISRK